MPRHGAVGAHFGLFSGRMKQAKGKSKGRRAARSLVEALEDRTLMSRTWIVAPWGNDASAGTLASPFRTIERAATLANWGDTVMIRGGTYRETVHPAHSGITFTRYGNENVTVSGADVISGFRDYRGGIYEARLPWTLGAGDNQVFVDGKMINEARWPNTGTDLSHPAKEYAQRITVSGSRATLYDSRLTAGWQGATIQILPGQGWYAQSGAVTASGRGWLTFSFAPDVAQQIPRSGNTYYLTGKFQGLDAPGEWFRDNAGGLYVWAPGNTNPATHRIEAKHRLYAFDLSSVSNTTIRGINIFAATIATSSASRSTVIDHIAATYLSQFVWQSPGWKQPSNSGIELNGANSTLSNSIIAWSAGDGVYVSAPNCRVTGNIIHDVDYNAGDSAAVRNFGAGAIISSNTIYNAGRCGIITRAAGAQVTWNVIHDAMLQTTDGGGIYTIRQNGGGSQIAYNTIYNVRAGGFGANGIMLDDDSSNFVIHDNRIWNTNNAIKLNYSSVRNRIYNNALQGTGAGVTGNGTYNWGGTSIFNNTLYTPVRSPGYGAAIYGNRFSSGSPAPSSLPSTAGPQPSPARALTYSAFGTWQAESWFAQSGLQVKYGALASADNRDWAEYRGVNFGAGATRFIASVAVSAPYARQQIQLRLDSPTGTLIGTLRPTSTGSYARFATESASITKVTGVHTLYVVFAGWSGIGNVDWFKFA